MPTQACLYSIDNMTQIQNHLTIRTLYNVSLYVQRLFNPPVHAFKSVVQTLGYGPLCNP